MNRARRKTDEGIFWPIIGLIAMASILAFGFALVTAGCASLGDQEIRNDGGGNVSADNSKTGVKAEAKGIEKKDESSNAGNQSKSDQNGIFNFSVNDTVAGATGAGVFGVVVLWLWLRSKAKEDEQESKRHQALLTHFKDQQEANRQFAERIFDKHVKALAEACLALAKGAAS